jgi:hypothetical protein
MDPRALAVDPKGNLFVADAQEQSVRRVDPAGVISTLAGTGGAGFNGDGLDARVSDLSNPSSLAIDRCGNLLIADHGSGRIRRFLLAPPCTPGPPVSDASGNGWKLTVGVAVLAVIGAALGLKLAIQRSRRVAHR